MHAKREAKSKVLPPPELVEFATAAKQFLHTHNLRILYEYCTTNYTAVPNVKAFSHKRRPCSVLAQILPMQLPCLKYFSHMRRPCAQHNFSYIYRPCLKGSFTHEKAVRLYAQILTQSLATFCKHSFLALHNHSLYTLHALFTTNNATHSLHAAKINQFCKLLQEIFLKTVPCHITKIILK
jgi:hypothetical protein